MNEIIQGLGRTISGELPIPFLRSADDAFLLWTSNAQVKKEGTRVVVKSNRIQQSTTSEWFWHNKSTESTLNEAKDIPLRMCSVHCAVVLKPLRVLGLCVWCANCEGTIVTSMLPARAALEIKFGIARPLAISLAWGKRPETLFNGRCQKSESNRKKRRNACCTLTNKNKTKVKAKAISLVW